MLNKLIDCRYLVHVRKASGLSGDRKLINCKCVTIRLHNNNV